MSACSVRVINHCIASTSVGALMLLAWMLTGSIGTIIASFYKPDWPNQTLLGQKVWFQVDSKHAHICTAICVRTFTDIMHKASYPSLKGNLYFPLPSDLSVTRSSTVLGLCEFIQALVDLGSDELVSATVSMRSCLQKV